MPDAQNPADGNQDTQNPADGMQDTQNQRVWGVKRGGWDRL